MKKKYDYGRIKQTILYLNTDLNMVSEKIKIKKHVLELILEYHFHNDKSEIPILEKTAETIGKALEELDKISKKSECIWQII